MPVVLVTGGAGFIGSHLVDRLLDEGYTVRVIDNLAVGRYDNIRQHEKNTRFHFVEADIRTAGVLPSLIHDVAVVYHLAALADIVPSIVAPADYFTTNVTGTVNMLEAARASGVKRFVYVASSSCYGIPDVYPTPETASIKPEYPYALTKNLGEQCVLHWGKVYGMPVAAVRFF
ncbi:MAG: SDR family NAD(P)-dependent oxidoreductase, partial [Candidatus Andersenbacteria bacterium]|nr:SDR family NAD(P)-dependent oxidoreductase [Candidatus Andersenbacteria bacterium]